MPVVLVFAHRSSPLLVSVAAACVALAASLEGRLGTLPAKARAALATPLGAAVAGFLGWAAASVLWAPSPAESLLSWGEFAGTAAAAFLVAVTLPTHMPRSARWLLVGGVGLACLLILLDLWTGLVVRQTFGMRVAYFVHNRPVLTLLVLAAPVLALAGGMRAAAAAAAALIAAAVMVAESGAAVAGLLLGALFFGAARVLPRTVVLAAAAAGLAGALVLAPIAGDILREAMPAAVHERLKGTSSRARVEIARAFGAAVKEDPWRGSGFGASPRLPETEAAGRLAPEFRALLGVGHPHNAALQIWVELGVVGVSLATAGAFLLLRSMAALPRDALAPRLALLMGASAASLVGHGAWQGWWPAAIGAAIMWLRYAEAIDWEDTR